MDFIVIKKVVSALLYPLGFTGVLLISAFIVSLLGRRVIARYLWAMAVMILLICSNPKFASYLTQSLEQQYPQVSMNQLPDSDAIIILGGMVRLPLPPAQQAQLGGRSERLWYGAQLYQAGKAPKILITGGNVFHQEGIRGEASYAAEILQKWGVAQSDIIIESTSRTTAQNAKFIVEQLQLHKIERALLVTSAMHMPRAMRHFQELPITIVPAAADILISDYQQPTVLEWVPSASALSLTTVALHEYYGLCFIWLQQLLGLEAR